MSSYINYLFGGKPKPSKSNYEYKLIHPFRRRRKESELAMRKYIDKLPVIIERSDHTNVGLIDKNKYLLPRDMTIGQLLYSIRRKIKLESYEGLFLFVDNSTIPRTNETIEEVYMKYKDKDNFLYITYSGENAFGR